MRGIVICVNYDDLLAISLPRNIRHLEECLVVTSPADTRTQDLVRSIPNCRLHITDAFYRQKASFNKGLAMEEGFDVLGREGWIVIWDADIVFPGNMAELLPELKPGTLYGPTRRILEKPAEYSDALDWFNLPRTNDVEFPGFFQLFHADDPVLVRRPWYDVSFTHAGGGDAYFQQLWPWNRRLRMDFDVLHLGPRDQNWFGRVTERADGLPLEGDIRARKEAMTKLMAFQGWGRFAVKTMMRSFFDRIIVPGYERSKYLWHKSKPPQ